MPLYALHHQEEWLSAARLSCDILCNKSSKGYNLEAYENLRHVYDYISESEKLTYEDVIPSEDESVEDQAMKELELQRLRDFLRTLSDEEMEIINALYLCNPDELSERKIAKQLGMAVMTLNDAKKRIFKKYKK